MTAAVRSARTMPLSLGLATLLVMVACVGLPAASDDPTPNPTPSASPTASAATVEFSPSPAVATAAPASPPTATDGPAPTTGAGATDTPPTSQPTPSPTATPAPTPRADLRWRELGRLGGAAFTHGEYEEIEWLVGFDSGYIAVQRTVGSLGDWASRVWFSTNGFAWEVLPVFDPEAQVLVAASNGEEVLLLISSPDYVTSAWITSNGRDWQSREEMAPGYFVSARAAWPGATGWYAALWEEYEGCEDPTYGCSRASLWHSSDGLTWRRVDLIPGEPSAGFTGPDGSLVVASDQLVRSADGGATWQRTRVARSCFHPYTPRMIMPAEDGTYPALIYGGEGQVCLGSNDLRRWQRVGLPTQSVLEPFRNGLVSTRHGLLVTGVRDCFDQPDCPPHVEQFLSLDGRAWVRLDAAISDLNKINELGVADGPAGVIGLSSTGYGPRDVAVWKLDDGP